MDSFRKKIFSALAFLALLLNLVSPAVALADQKATPSADPSTAITTPDVTSSATVDNQTQQVDQTDATPSAETLTPNPTPEPSVTPAPDASSSATTTSPTTVPDQTTTYNNVVLNQTYASNQNSKVTVIFTKLPDSAGNVSIKEISTASFAGIKPITSTAYDISSDMTNGTFEYTLTLPTPTTNNVEVKTSEGGQNFVTVGGVTPTGDTLTITGINHFSIFVVSFESPTYSVGSINGQDGSSATGAYDQSIVANTYGYSSFGSQSFRISDAITSGSFGDQTFLKPLTDSVGETSASAGTFSVGTRFNHFEAQFDIASAVPNAQQPGMHTSVSPDRGDGSRMSYLRFEDNTGGIDVFFDDVQGTTNPANFVETQVGTNLDRTKSHSIKLSLDTPDGPSNDVVKVYIDEVLVHTGTSWENYYRYDSESSAEQSPRIVKTLLFRAAGTATPADSGKGFLIDNVSLSDSYASTTSGQSSLPSGTTSVSSSGTSLDLSGGLSTASGGNITVAGSSISLNSFTSGDLSGINLTTPQSVGDQSITINKAVQLASGTSGQPVVITNTSLSNVSLSIPDSTTILGPSGWDGTIKPPTTASSTGTAPSGFSVGNTVVEVGSSNNTLLFDKPVSVVLTGVTGSVGYKPAGSSNWVEITNTCAGTYANPANPTFPGECFISNGTDTKIFTYHLTTFASLTANASPGNSGGGQSLSAASAPSCNDSAPASAPTLLSATSTGTNQITLTWSKAANPVSYYLVTYGTSSGSQQYGNPNVGGADTTSYTVSGLSGGVTYFFKVRAGNGCAPGSFSNELSASTTGGQLTGPATGFAPGVLGTATASGNQTTKTQGEVEAAATSTPSASIQPSPAPSPTSVLPAFGKRQIALVVLGILALLGTFIYLDSRRKNSP